MDNYNGNRCLPQNEWVQAFRDALKENFDKTANTKEGHFYDHISHTDKEMLTNLILGTKHFDAVFTDEKHGKGWTKQILGAKAPVIYDWLQANKQQFESYDQYKNLHFSIRFTNVDAVGKGYTKEFAEKATKHIDVFLRRDSSGKSPFGFYLETGFPNINHEQAWDTGKSYTKDEIIQGQYVPFDNDYERIAFKFQDQYEDITLRTCTDTSGEPQVKITFEDTYGNYVVYLGDNHEKCTHFSDQGKTYPSIKAIPKEYQEFINEVKEYRKYLEHMPLEDKLQDMDKFGGPIKTDEMISEITPKEHYNTR